MLSKLIKSPTWNQDSRQTVSLRLSPSAQITSHFWHSLWHILTSSIYAYLLKIFKAKPTRNWILRQLSFHTKFVLTFKYKIWGPFQAATKLQFCNSYWCMLKILCLYTLHQTKLWNVPDMNQINSASLLVYVLCISARINVNYIIN